MEMRGACCVGMGIIWTWRVLNAENASTTATSATAQPTATPARLSTRSEETENAPSLGSPIS